MKEVRQIHKIWVVIIIQALQSHVGFVSSFIKNNIIKYMQNIYSLKEIHYL